MCGIFGYIGKGEALPFLIEGLKKLEYRGYDSAGVATLEHGHVFVAKREGKISGLEELLRDKPIGGNVGIGHTRWATHGRPSDQNSHPHVCCNGKIALVHNGIIENYLELRRQLSEEGHKFRSATDTEVLVHLVEKHFSGDLTQAVMAALREVVGSYAIAVICEDEPTRIVVARKGSPLVIGLGDGETFIASDIAAIVKYTSRILYIEDEEVVTVKNRSAQIFKLNGSPVKRKTSFVSWDPESAEKGGFAHFMLKEIHEQPNALRKTIADRVDMEAGKIHFDELNLELKEIKQFNRVIFTACGTSWHAALVGEYLMEGIAKLSAEVEYAAEFRYREPIVDEKTLVVAVSQSGETADTLGAIWEAKARGAKVISICNVMGSSIARESHGVIYTEAGPEIGVASTKAFTTQLAVIYLLTILFGRVRKAIAQPEAMEMIRHLMEIPDKVERILAKEEEIEKMSARYFNSTNALYLGRGKGFPVALEGALKLKEVSYIHAEGYPAAEMKHGPIALIDQNMPVVFLAMKGRRYDKILGNIEEVKARGGMVIAVATEGDFEIKDKADEVVYIPATVEEVSPILAVVPLQLFAYYIAVKRGCHVDQPRNLAKSVTVE